MTAYAIAVLRPAPPLHPDVYTYIELVQSTFEPYGGRFLVHGTPGEWVEGGALGDIVLVEFPDLDRAHAWYASDAYQAILPMRADNIPGELALLQGVPDDYAAGTTARAMRRAAGSGVSPS
ncbi:DUF1330 domain-containing protein [Streptomyces beihaiensis]|uniref:DUF1330 domain-containing protein n=1 Tax=Streptomyces beihaiensis TaxID=2984495 RepID=A0ABT3TUH0_9ACTN|nr:DUF1330 domain-containing protein [Streptomyces beihaiensis]MCX3060684.1 DUF1330 domain-containing protein [Streptomyces beihaiensis]